MRFFTTPARYLLLCCMLIALSLGACSTGPSAPKAHPSTHNSYRFEGGSVEVLVTGQSCQLTLHGEIHNGTQRSMSLALQAAETAACTHKVARLNTTQGLLGDAITLGAMLRNRGYDTELAPGSACQTPCLLVFAAGQQRRTPEGTTLAFTQIPPDQDFGGQSCATELSQGQHLTLTRYLRAMLGTQTGTAVYRKILAATCSSTSVYGPAEALAMGLATPVTPTTPGTDTRP